MNITHTLHTRVIDECTIHDRYTIHLLQVKDTLLYMVCTTDHRADTTQRLYSTHSVGAAVDKYTSLINTISSITTTIDRWFNDNKTRVDKDIDILVEKIAARADNYGTDYED